MKTNCLLWAVAQWRRFGGYVAFRATRVRMRNGRLGWWPHVLWSPDLKRWLSFVPYPDPGPTLGFLPPWRFKGRVVEGDAPKEGPTP